MLCLHKDKSPTPPSPDLQPPQSVKSISTYSQCPKSLRGLLPSNCHPSSDHKTKLRRELAVVLGKEYYLGALKAKPSSTRWKLGERSVCSPPWWDGMLCGWQARERNLCRMPGSCCSANDRLRGVTYFQRTLLSSLNDIICKIILQVLAMHHPRKLFPQFLLFAAKNTTALLFCQITSWFQLLAVVLVCQPDWRIHYL